MLRIISNKLKTNFRQLLSLSNYKLQHNPTIKTDSTIKIGYRMGVVACSNTSYHNLGQQWSANNVILNSGVFNTYSIDNQTYHQFANISVLDLTNKNYPRVCGLQPEPNCTTNIIMPFFRSKRNFTHEYFTIVISLFSVHMMNNQLWDCTFTMSNGQLLRINETSVTFNGLVEFAPTTKGSAMRERHLTIFYFTRENPYLETSNSGYEMNLTIYAGDKRQIEPPTHILPVVFGLIGIFYVLIIGLVYLWKTVCFDKPKPNVVGAITDSGRRIQFVH